MNGIMSADFCCVPMWTPLVRYVSSGTRSPSAPIRSSSCILFLDEPLLDPDELVQFRDSLPAHGARLDPEAPEATARFPIRSALRSPPPWEVPAAYPWPGARAAAAFAPDRP